MSPSLHFSMFPCVSIFPCLNLHMSPSPYMYLHLHMSPCPYLHVSGILQTENGTNRKRQQLLLDFWKWKWTETANFRLFAANGKRKMDVCFHWLANERQMVVDNCCFIKHAHLWVNHVFFKAVQRDLTFNWITNQLLPIALPAYIKILPRIFAEMLGGALW